MIQLLTFLLRNPRNLQGTTPDLHDPDEAAHAPAYQADVRHTVQQLPSFRRDGTVWSWHVVFRRLRVGALFDLVLLVKQGFLQMISLALLPTAVNTIAKKLESSCHKVQRNKQGCHHQESCTEDFR